MEKLIVTKRYFVIIRYIVFFILLFHNYSDAFSQNMMPETQFKMNIDADNNIAYLGDSIVKFDGSYSISPDSTTIALMYLVKSPRYKVKIYRNTGMLVKQIEIESKFRFVLADNDKYCLFYRGLSVRYLPKKMFIYSFDGELLYSQIDDNRIARFVSFSIENELFIYVLSRTGMNLGDYNNFEVQIFNKNFEKVGEYYEKMDKIYYLNEPLITKDNNIIIFRREEVRGRFVKQTLIIDRFGKEIQKLEGWIEN